MNEQYNIISSTAAGGAPTSTARIETPEEFVKRLPWMSLNEEPDLEQWANHVRYRDAAICAECVERAIAWYTKDAGPELLPMYQSGVPGLRAAIEGKEVPSAV